MWDLSSPTRNQTHTPCIGGQSPNHWNNRQVPHLDMLWRPFSPLDRPHQGPSLLPSPLYLPCSILFFFPLYLFIIIIFYLSMSWLCHVGSSWPGMEPEPLALGGPLHWVGQVLTTGLPGKPLSSAFNCLLFSSFPMLSNSWQEQVRGLQVQEGSWRRGQWKARGFGLGRLAVHPMLGRHQLLR